MMESYLSKMFPNFDEIEQDDIKVWENFFNKNIFFKDFVHGVFPNDIIDKHLNNKNNNIIKMWADDKRLPLTTQQYHFFKMLCNLKIVGKFHVATHMFPVSRFNSLASFQRRLKELQLKDYIVIRKDYKYKRVNRHLCIMTGISSFDVRCFNSKKKVINYGKCKGEATRKYAKERCRKYFKWLSNKKKRLYKQRENI